MSPMIQPASASLHLLLPNTAARRSLCPETPSLCPIFAVPLPSQPHLYASPLFRYKPVPSCPPPSESPPRRTHPSVCPIPPVSLLLIPPIMRSSWRVIPFLIPALAAAFAFAAPPSPHSEVALEHLDVAPQHEALLYKRDGHGHHHMGAPLTELNETEVLMYHAPTPPSYYTIDFEGDGPLNEKRYPGLMGLHVLFMGLAFFGALPIGIALRSVKHAWHGFSVIAFWSFVVLGLSAGGLYNKLTPNMYEGNKHSILGYFVLLFALVISAVDVIALAGRLVGYIKAIRSGEETFGVKAAWNIVVLDREQRAPANAAEYTNLVVEDPEEYDTAELKAREIEEEGESEPLHVRRARFVDPIDTTAASAPSDPHDETAEWANNVEPHEVFPRSAASDRTLFGPRSPRGSLHSDETLQESSYWISTTKTSLLRRVGRGVFATAERVLVFAGYLQLITGIVEYTGGCRENYVNGCLAHLIKGSIFWAYGLVTFARFLGSFSEHGWAWNRAPSRSYPSAEFVESFVIFLYGITNTWMERFGALPGDPFTTKQVQHISIAVMFWFAGLVGMGIESKRVRRWLASGSTAAVPEALRSQEAVAEPPSYIASFNPFPALCIGVTGAAMAAHAQSYLFQVQIHMLWGNLLTAFAVLRCLTYFFLWLGPPRSILPSRPPTEALAAFFLACGGLVFMFSTEEVTIAAMRRGHDDMMMFLNVAVAVTCLACCWVLGVVAFKGWLKSHTHATMKFHSSA
ncbi:hypothetical protein EIP91_000723 [Steccherinum ochraceum]|uniref:Protein YTP1-like C-terminal domain-containing protein n=1 Tax=Steccherinum ochraceum TaxID=92696 RepID=A0A4R0RLS2_9APHY|nr:hypothetical protein EIP91_000723 [Steccherinum ochraceum]